MNERNTGDNKPKGVTRKSASSVKPKREAAASVTVVTKTKSKAEKKAEKRKQEEKQREKVNKYYNPRTPEYKRLRMIWAVLVGVALVTSVASFFLMDSAPQAVTTVVLIIAYAAIAAALYIDLVKIRRLRNNYAATQSGSKAESRARRAEKAAQAKAGTAQPEQKPSLGQRIKGIFGGK